MLSSRVDDPRSSLPDGTSIRDLRDDLKKRITSVELPGADERLFDVFVNEGEAALAGDGDVERHCREQIRKADIVLVLYNGSAGWASQGLEGICHIELRAAMETAPHKVRIIRLPLTRKPTAADKRFREYAEAQRPFSTDQAYATIEDIAEQSMKALRTAIVTMVSERAREGSLRAARSHGDAFSWARLSWLTAPRQCDRRWSRRWRRPGMPSGCRTATTSWPCRGRMQTSYSGSAPCPVR
ncbi:MAG: hypothetical protein ACLQA5_25035 [Solirubrobacteraceae bacterium]